MSDFAEFFSGDAIIRELCKARLSIASQRHEALFLHNIDRTKRPAEEVPITWGDVSLEIFPPRRQWNRHRPKDRSGRGRNIALETLLRAVRRLTKETPTASWVGRLKATVAAIRARALDAPGFAFASPTIMPEVKDAKSHAYRPLASFPLSDRIIDCLTARYFRTTLDHALKESCLAFRPRRDGRHAGLDGVWAKRPVAHGGTVFVAECDIMGFYDCVAHSTARSSLGRLVADAKSIDPDVEIDPRALEIFDSYLACYSFLRSVRGEAEPTLQSKRPKGSYPWREQQLLELHGYGEPLDNIGVPQGGSISTLIANAVLHAADTAVEPFVQQQDVTYLRYCDDMILLGQDQDACKQAFVSYCDTLKELKLPIHKPDSLKPYDGDTRKDFWRAKSKPVYPWASPQVLNSYPWVQFLGYQIRYDGAVRVRRSSIAKESAKLATTADKLLRVLRQSNAPNIRRGARSIKHRFRMKLIAMSVGRRDVGQALGEPLPNCWANGFRWLTGKLILASNLRALDRQRERQISRVARRLKGLELPHSAPSTNQKPRKYYGHPFSYYGQFRSLRPEGD
ncbi:MAG: hypothetical protein GC160_15610 [Acidobacteria bacterium]|nr:hypothetical protein [Acidobacteriota bacterium]